LSNEQPSPIRRVVTGHDENGVAKVLWDSAATNVRRGGHGNQSTLMWCSDAMPIPMPVGERIEDMGERVLGTPPPPHGTRFTVNDLPPGQPGRMHRTETVDYALILAGEIDMEVDNGERISLNPGDVVIQRGTNHSWINRGTTWGRIAFILCDAVPLGIGDPLPRAGSAGG
jgi:quercetin dioxygenase-like cupin family protein